VQAGDDLELVLGTRHQPKVQCTTHSTNNGTPSIDRSVSLRPFRDPGLLLGPKQRGVDLLRGARGQAKCK